MNKVDILEEVKVLKVIRHICREVSRGCKNNGNKQGNDEVASYRINI